jgi:hypothetical protein
MAYGLRYTISQILRNESLLEVEILEKDYTDIEVKSYTATNIILQPNASQDYPNPQIISSQLNFSFILETEDDYIQFPDVLTSDDRKYWVILKEDSNVIWRGFLFNDYSQVGFTTGIQEAYLVAVDGISFIENVPYVVDDSINKTENLLSIISKGLNNMLYPEDLNLVVACSYFAEGMQTRLDGEEYEPLSQTYQYRRDFLNMSYYDIILNILTSFNCRLFQSNGDWWFMSMNEMSADTNYYTKYSLMPTIDMIDYGILDTQIDIEPYAMGNVHFINNSQTKVLKKGFFNISYRGKFESPLNFVHNSDLKINDGTNAQGWIKQQSGSGTATLIINQGTVLSPNPEEQFNDWFLTRATTGSASVEMGSLGPFDPYYYLPFIGGTDNYVLKMEHKTISECKVQIQLIISPSNIKYLNTSGAWQTGATTIPLPASASGNFENFTLKIPKNSNVIETFFGHIKVKIIADTNGATTTVRNFNIQLDVRSVKYVEVVYNPENLPASSQKVYEQPYGNTYPTAFVGIVNSYTIINKGCFYDLDGNYLKNWATVVSGNLLGAPVLITFMTYQQMKLSNKTIATLEADLGNFKANNGYIYLDKTFSVTDITGGNLSYDGKKFMINRMSLNSYLDETTSIQFIEVTNYGDYPFAFFLIPNYIMDTGALQPFWDIQLNIF